jgi:hypothetical protein
LCGTLDAPVSTRLCPTESNALPRRRDLAKTRWICSGQAVQTLPATFPASISPTCSTWDRSGRTPRGMPSLSGHHLSGHHLYVTESSRMARPLPPPRCGAGSYTPRQDHGGSLGPPAVPYGDLHRRSRLRLEGPVPNSPARALQSALVGIEPRLSRLFRGRQTGTPRSDGSVLRSRCPLPLHHRSPPGSQERKSSSTFTIAVPRGGGSSRRSPASSTSSSASPWSCALPRHRVDNTRRQCWSQPCPRGPSPGSGLGRAGPSNLAHTRRRGHGLHWVITGLGIPRAPPRLARLLHHEGRWVHLRAVVGFSDRTTAREPVAVAAALRAKPPGLSLIAAEFALEGVERDLVISNSRLPGACELHCRRSVSTLGP